MPTVNYTDERVMEDITHITDPFSKIDALHPIAFNFKGDKNRIEGFSAKELKDIVPQAVEGSCDDVDENGNIKLQKTDTTKLIPILTAGLQENRKNILTTKRTVVDVNNDTLRHEKEIIDAHMKIDRNLSDLTVANLRIEELQAKIDILADKYTKEFHFKKPFFMKSKRQFFQQ